MSDTNTDSTVPDLYRLAFMPWAVPAARMRLRSPKGARNAVTGEIGTRAEDRESEPCSFNEWHEDGSCNVVPRASGGLRGEIEGRI